MEKYKNIIKKVSPEDFTKEPCYYNIISKRYFRVCNCCGCGQLKWSISELEIQNDCVGFYHCVSVKTKKEALQIINDWTK